MLDLGISKAALIAVVALVVIGPARLPQVARQLGTWTRKCRSFVDELRNEMARAVQAADITHITSEVSDAANAFCSSLSSEFEALGYSAREAGMNQESPPFTAARGRKKPVLNQAPNWYKKQYTFKNKVTSCAARGAARGRGVTRP